MLVHKAGGQVSHAYNGLSGSRSEGLASSALVLKTRAWCQAFFIFVAFPQLDVMHAGAAASARWTIGRHSCTDDWSVTTRQSGLQERE